jgi:hypothetical protein
LYSPTRRHPPSLVVGTTGTSATLNEIVSVGSLLIEIYYMESTSGDSTRPHFATIRPEIKLRKASAKLGTVQRRKYASNCFVARMHQTAQHEQPSTGKQSQQQRGKSKIYRALRLKNQEYTHIRSSATPSPTFSTSHFSPQNLTKPLIHAPLARTLPQTDQN